MFSRGKQSFELRDEENVVRVTTSKGGNSHEYTLPIEIISPKPSRVKRLDVQMRPRQRFHLRMNFASWANSEKTESFRKKSSSKPRPRFLPAWKSNLLGSSWNK